MSAEKRSAMNAVEVVIKKTIAGDASVGPYSHHDGLQFYRPLGAPYTRPVRYRVPAYEVYVGTTGPFRAIRFGLINNGSAPTAQRLCDTGLFQERVCHPTWAPTYSPR